ncbi:hypothetical protein [Streptomyces vilmorinianum]|uniref:hypothetical protein n=1 Tax=Streptomyces vilmorinianum TaxID=3051092 RepID=UPI0010FAD5DF|nr:hypothetical protein [Streptomyces vilmorinianum]
MGSQARYTGHDPEAEPVCPACGQPVGTAVKRHKVLGAWVPFWEPQPCHNPDCELFGRKADGTRPPGEPSAGDPSGEASGVVPEDTSGEPPAVAPSGEAPSGEAPGGGAPGGAEATTTHVTGKNGETGRSPATG